jgi:hypothetical protein
MKLYRQQEQMIHRIRDENFRKKWLPASMLINHEDLCLWLFDEPFASQGVGLERKDKK